MVILQLQVELRTVKAGLPRTDVLPTVLCNQYQGIDDVFTKSSRACFRGLWLAVVCISDIESAGKIDIDILCIQEAVLSVN